MQSCRVFVVVVVVVVLVICRREKKRCEKFNFEKIHKSKMMFNKTQVFDSTNSRCPNVTQGESR